jgi:DNA primase
VTGHSHPPSPRDASNKYSIDGYHDVVAIHEIAARFYREQLAGSWAPGYLARRGFSAAVQRQWQIGYAPAGRQVLTQYLRGAGYRDALIVAAGLARRSRYGELSDVFRDRVMFPIRSPRGSIVGFIGRAGEHTGADVPRYLNSPATVLYDKGRVLFGLWEARPALAQGAVPVIVEGPLDAIAVAATGHSDYAPIAPCGTALTAHQVPTLSQAADLSATGVLVAFDGDEAGQRAAVRAYPLLRLHTDRINAITFPPGHDAAQILHDHGPGVLAQMLASHVVPLADLVIDAQVASWEPGLRFAEGQIGALRATAPVIAGLAPREVPCQVARLAERLELDHPTVTEAVTDALTTLIQTRSQADLGRGHQGELSDCWPAAVRTSRQDSPYRPFSHLAEPAILPAPRRTPGSADRQVLGGNRVAS